MSTANPTPNGINDERTPAQKAAEAAKHDALLKATPCEKVVEAARATMHRTMRPT